MSANYNNFFTTDVFYIPGIKNRTAIKTAYKLSGKFVFLKSSFMTGRKFSTGNAEFVHSQPLEGERNFEAYTSEQLIAFENFKIAILFLIQFQFSVDQWFWSQLREFVILGELPRDSLDYTQTEFVSEMVRRLTVLAQNWKLMMTPSYENSDSNLQCSLTRGTLSSMISLSLPLIFGVGLIIIWAILIMAGIVAWHRTKHSRKNLFESQNTEDGNQNLEFAIDELCDNAYLTLMRGMD
jgi:hypothetical protein